MYPYQQPYDGYDDRQFNMPGFFGGFFGGGGSQFPGGPSGGPPGFPGGQPGTPGGEQAAGAPTTPPPPFTPTQPQFQTKAIDPGGIQGCLYRFTYMWLRRDSFWFFPVFVGRNSVSGFRWYFNRWVYYGIDLDRVESFQCF